MNEKELLAGACKLFRLISCQVEKLCFGMTIGEKCRIFMWLDLHIRKLKN